MSRKKEGKETGYDFNINVSQIGAMNAGLIDEILFEEIGIFEMFIKYTSWSKAEKIILDNEVYFAFNWKIILQRIPTLKAKRPTAIRAKIKKLVTFQLLKPHPENQRMAKAFFSFGEKYQAYANIKPYRKNDKEVIGKTIRPYRKNDKEVIGKTTRRLSEKRQAPYRKSDNNDISNDNTNDNTDIFLKKEFKNFSKKQEKWIGWKKYLLEEKGIELHQRQEDAQMEHLKNLSDNDVTIADKIITQAVAGGYKNFAALSLKNKFSAAPNFPDTWSKSYESQLSGKQLSDYWQHLRSKGLEPVKHQNVVIKWEIPQPSK